MSLMSLFALSNAFAAKGKTESDATTGSSFRAMIWLIYGFFFPVIYTTNEMWYVQRCKKKAYAKIKNVKRSIVPRHLFTTGKGGSDQLKTEFRVLKECGGWKYEESLLIQEAYESSEYIKDIVSEKKMYMVTMGKKSSNPPTSQLFNLIPAMSFQSEPIDHSTSQRNQFSDTQQESLSVMLEKPAEELLEMLHSIPNGSVFERAVSDLVDRNKLTKLLNILVNQALVLRKQWVIKKRLTVHMGRKISLLMEKFHILSIRIQRMDGVLKKSQKPIFPGENWE
eukprot:TRINITY_DN1463_c2_g1_i3.p1 TRINITY_DN1463_c2_g1~~TRINITY_DN1463_c2_g1_i3.p1  ORF type:complete len:281 (+),score=49.78 TRINITY_DN1463_c2_g1_i3:124-966(+)